jgi:hypothetical protein
VPSFSLANDVALECFCRPSVRCCTPGCHCSTSAGRIDNSTRALGQFAFALAFFLLFVGKAGWTLTRRDWGGLLFSPSA